MRYVIGIDEVGRGALAGPVVVAAAIMPWSAIAKLENRKKLKDSKKLTPKARETWARYFDSHPTIDYALARVYPRQIEKRNIARAANLAAARAFKRLAKVYRLSPKTAIFLDGGLFLGSRAEQPKNAKTVIKGDEKIPAVAIASIVAKVSRDRFMCRLAKKYPAYRFEVHKGYGTKVHLEAIGKIGPCDAHRLTFIGKRVG